MTQTNTPGIKAMHAIVTPVCTANKGNDGAISEALERLRKEAERILPLWQGRGVSCNLNFVLTVERVE